MTNKAIIETEKLYRGIIEDCHTYAGWQARGMQVKKGSKALFKAAIWKHKNAAKDKDGNEKPAKMFLTTAAFFGISQVEPIKA